MKLTPTRTFQETFKGAICVCYHCGNRYGATGGTSCSLYCGSCKTAEQRKAMDDENKALMPWYSCQFCAQVEAEKAAEKNRTT